MVIKIYFYRVKYSIGNKRSQIEDKNCFILEQIALRILYMNKSGNILKNVVILVCFLVRILTSSILKKSN